MLQLKFIQHSKNLISKSSSSLLVFGKNSSNVYPLLSKMDHSVIQRGFRSCLYHNNAVSPQTPTSQQQVVPPPVVASGTSVSSPVTVVQTSVVDGVVSTSSSTSSVISTSTSSTSQPNNTAATIVIIQQQQPTQPSQTSSSSLANGTGEGVVPTSDQQQTALPSTGNQQQTIIQIDTQVFSKQIEQAVKQQMKQSLTKHAYEPTGEESFEIMEHLERERLYEESKGKGLIYQFRRFMKKKTSLLTNLLAIGKILPANAIMSLFFSFHKMEQNYKERIFAQRITASLNFIDKKTSTFKIRNIFCKNLDEVVLNNQAVVQVIQEAASKTNKEAPIVILPDEDKWFILNLVQSCISQNVASGYFRQDMMLKHHSEWYVFAITNETDVSIKKMRVVIVQEKLLKSIHDGTVNQPEFEHVYGEIRWNTVKLMSKMYHEQYESIMETGFGDLQRVEVVLSGSTAE